MELWLFKQTISIASLDLKTKTINALQKKPTQMKMKKKIANKRNSNERSRVLKISVGYLFCLI